MNIAVLSGKGGTGKTTISTNLALVMSANYIDCDVEEPNGFIFLKPEIVNSKKVNVDYPCINDEKCNNCGDCASVCQFNALAKTKKNVLLFEKLCHSCGACEIVCKTDALHYKKRPIGVIEEGILNNINCKRGILNIGEPMAVPIIRELLKNIKEGINIIDCSPGTSCNVVSSLQYVDLALLVTEPTEFGLHDLKMAVELVKKFNIPMAIIINKEVSQDSIVHNYCIQEKIPIVGSLPYSRDIAKEYSSGNMLVNNKKYKKIFDNIATKVKEGYLWN
ncbi:P-loop NTPase [Clostridium acetireducens]|uniref:P-loop NTPase n=1 Tax=Clostridium acetireducens TaxID=76489 RepID=UPI000872B0B6|nr:ATP-binding protein [Clostridium acetireducens]